MASASLALSASLQGNCLLSSSKAVVSCSSSSASSSSNASRSSPGFKPFSLNSSFTPRLSCPSAAKVSKDVKISQRLQVRAGLIDFVGGDLLGFDLGRWEDDVEKYGSIGFYSPPEGGIEGRYATTLKNKRYHLMNISARGLGDPEAYLTKVHGVRPPHLGKEAVARFYLPPEVDYRLSVLPKNSKGLVLWIGEAKVLAKNELQYLALLPTIRPNVRVIAEMGGSRKFIWKPLKDIAGLPSQSASS